MPYLWSFVIDLAVFVVLYKYRPLWMFAHVIIGFGVAFVTLLFALPILRQNGIPETENAFKLQRHFIIGTVILAIVFLQVIMGITANVMKMIKTSSTVGIYFFNTFHKYLGYCLLILSKFQFFLILDHNGNHPSLFWTLLAIDIVMFLLFVAQKIWFPTFAT